MNFLNLDKAQQASVTITLHGFYQDVLAKKDKFSGQITPQTIAYTLADVNPNCVERCNDGEYFWAIDTKDESTYYKVQSKLYDSVKPLHMILDALNHKQA